MYHLIHQPRLWKEGIRMLDESDVSLARISDTEIAVRTTLDGQDILIQQGDIGRNLANLLWNR